MSVARHHWRRGARAALQRRRRTSSRRRAPHGNAGSRRRASVVLHNNDGHCSLAPLVASSGMLYLYNIVGRFNADALHHCSGARRRPSKRWLPPPWHCSAAAEGRWSPMVCSASARLQQRAAPGGLQLQRRWRFCKQRAESSVLHRTELQRRRRRSTVDGAGV